MTEASSRIRVGRLGLKSLAALLIVGIVFGATIFSFALYQISQEGIPLLPREPFRFLITSEAGGLYVFDGSNLSPIDLASVNLTPSQHLIAAGWRHDGAYALISGTHGVLLKYDGRSVERIQTGLDTSLVLFAVSWKPDDSQALIAGSRGTVLLFDGSTIRPIPTSISEDIFDAKWNPDGTVALLAGENGLIAEYDGNSFRRISSPVTFSLHGLEWHPSGSHALIGGFNATLLEYDGRILTPVYTLGFFGNNPSDAHDIRDITFSSTTAAALITGAGGLTMLYDKGKLSRTEVFTDLRGHLVDLHQIGHFRSSAWVEGTLTAFAVGDKGAIGRVTNMVVTLVHQGQTGIDFRDIVSF